MGRNVLQGQNCFTRPQWCQREQRDSKCGLQQGLSCAELLLLSLARTRCCRREHKKSWRWQPQNQLPTGKVSSKSCYSDVSLDPGTLIVIFPVITVSICLLCVPTTVTLKPLRWKLERKNKVSSQTLCLFWKDFIITFLRLENSFALLVGCTKSQSILNTQNKWCQVMQF